MDPDFWRDRWQRQDIGFHQAESHDQLRRHWPALGIAPGSPVFVPLCGKSLDMVWLAGQGHRVIGAELSEIAIDDFFAERGLVPAVRNEGSFRVKTAEAYELWCGDIFDLPQGAVAGVAGVYDRAALVAFPAELQPRYAAKLKELVPPAAPILLVKVVTKDGGKPKGVAVSALYPEGKGQFGGRLILRNGLRSDVSFEEQKDGRFRSSQLLPDEEVTVTGHAEGYQEASTKVKIPEGETKEIEIVLEKK